MRKLVMSSLQDEQINDDEQGKSFSANCCQKAGMSKKFLRSLRFLTMGGNCHVSDIV